MTDLIMIGGSAGSFRPVCSILKHLRKDFPVPLVLVLHRLKNINEGFEEILNTYDLNKRVIEPKDKEPLTPGNIYLAPANYHLLIAKEKIFNLSTDSVFNFSRPSIDLAFISASEVYGSGMLGIILSGANRDGAVGMKNVKLNGGCTIVQLPEECEMDTMPLAAKRNTRIDYVFTTREIITHINCIPDK